MCHSPYAHLILCEETRDEVIERFRTVLGGKYFTLVTANALDERDHKFAMLDVEASQFIVDGVKFDPERDYTHISWETPKLVMGVSTSAKTRQEAHNGLRHEYVHFTFEPRKIVIDHYAPARNKLRWIFAVEDHAQETGPQAFYHEPVVAT